MLSENLSITITTKETLLSECKYINRSLKPNHIQSRHVLSERSQKDFQRIGLN